VKTDKQIIPCLGREHTLEVCDPSLRLPIEATNAAPPSSTPFVQICEESLDGDGLRLIANLSIRQHGDDNSTEFVVFFHRIRHRFDAYGLCF
jgi:hypothetical protein